MSCAELDIIAVICADAAVCRCATVAHSSYDFLFAKPAMRWLLNDYMNPGYRGWLHFRPAEDLRLSVSADLHGGSTEQLGRDTTGAHFAVSSVLPGISTVSMLQTDRQPSPRSSCGRACTASASAGLHFVGSNQCRTRVPLVCAQIPPLNGAMAAQAR